MKALVTEGAGFLSSHFCNLLLSKGDEVICTEYLITRNTRNINRIKNETFKNIRYDIKKPIASPIDYGIAYTENIKINIKYFKVFLEIVNK